MKKYRAVIFDMDGTILNTITDLLNATNYALKAFGLPERTLEEEYYFVGNGLHKTVERAVPEGTDPELLEQVFETMISYYKQHSEDETKPYEGITEVIRELKNAGIKTAVVSNKANEAVQHLVERFFDGCFDVSMGETNGFALKPEKDMVVEILKRLGVENGDAVYVGDSNVDLQTANNSGMDCIAVSWGFRGREKLTEYGAGTIIDEPKELLELVL